MEKFGSHVGFRLAPDSVWGMADKYPYSTVVVLVRRLVEDFIYPAKMGKAAAAEICEAIHAQVRVDRPGVTAAFLPTGNGRSKFARLDPVSRPDTHDLARVIERGTAAERKAWAARLGKCAVVVGTDDLGRCKRDPDKSTGQSVLLWAKSNLAPFGLCHGEDVTPLVIPAEMAKAAKLI